MTRSLALAALVGALLTGTSLAQAPTYGDLATAGTDTQGLRPGIDFPMLEFDSRVGLLTSKARVILHENGSSRTLGILDQNLAMSAHDAYRFRDDGEDTPEKARVNFIDVSADVGVKIKLQHPGFRGKEVGRIRQRALFSFGSGIDVYEKNDFKKKIGYIDQKVRETIGESLLRGFATFGLHTPDKVYTFYQITYREVANTGLRVSRIWSDTRLEPVQTPLFHFTTGKAAGTGPGGVFLKPDGTPILAIKGDWWVSQNIFDLLVRRVDNEGTTGKVIRGIGVAAEILAGDVDDGLQSLEGADDFVRNDSAFLGSWLIGLIYFQEYRDLVGINLPIAAVQ